MGVHQLRLNVLQYINREQGATCLHISTLRAEALFLTELKKKKLKMTSVSDVRFAVYL